MDFSLDNQNSPFVLCALASGLVDQDQLDEARAEIERAGETLENDKRTIEQRLADALVGLGYLNTWQVIQLQQGRTKFTLGLYRIVDSLGRGGMGQVFKGEHSVLGREVAIKVLPRETSTPEAVANFTREMKTLARLDHPNLVRAYDAGQDGNVHFLVTEYVPGQDLRKMVRKHGHLDMPTAAGIISQVAAGLQHAHERGLIHRDVKPGNVLVTPEGTAKLSDLGLAGPLEGDLESDPRYGKIAGTADYLSPDHIQSPRDPTPAWDVYSLGCTLYYAVTGKVPFPTGSTSDKVKAHCEWQPLDPGRLNKDLDPSFIQVIADMMAKDPADRVPSAKDVIARLRPWLPAEHSLPAPPIAAGRRDGSAAANGFRTEDPAPGDCDAPPASAAGAPGHLIAPPGNPGPRPPSIWGPLVLFVLLPLGLIGLLAVAWSVLAAIQ